MNREQWLEAAILKEKAKAAAARARKKGILKMADKCERCSQKATLGHHPDYSKPLEVIWLCRSCHTKEHAREYKNRRPRFRCSRTARQTTRLIKMWCLECGYTVRTAIKWIEEYGPVPCPCNGEIMSFEPPETKE